MRASFLCGVCLGLLPYLVTAFLHQLARPLSGSRLTINRTSYTRRRTHAHSEQRGAYKPPSPVLDDGHVVDISGLQDLVESGVLTIIDRRLDYAEKRSDGYTEPLQIFLLGTSHTSQQSAVDVKRVVDAVKPQSVVVELCRSRAGLLEGGDEEDGEGSAAGLELYGESLTEAVLRSIKNGGQISVLLRVALARIASKETKQSRLGTDFRAAYAAATDIGAEIVLGDRPIEITLSRAWEALSAGERLKLLGGTFFGLFKKVPKLSTRGATTDADILSVVQSGRVDEDFLEKLMGELAVHFPNVVGPLVGERDTFMAWSIKRSRAVCGTRRVVAVIGRAHIRGVLAAIRNDNGGDTLVFKDLAKKSKTVEEGKSPKAAILLILRILGETIGSWYLWEWWLEHNP